MYFRRFYLIFFKIFWLKSNKSQLISSLPTRSTICLLICALDLKLSTPRSRNVSNQISRSQACHAKLKEYKLIAKIVIDVYNTLL